MPAPTYIAYNGPMATTAAPAKVATGAVIKTLLQIQAPAAGPQIRPIAWGISFDGSAAATPGVCELVETNVAATVTAYVAADVQKYANSQAQASLLTLGTAASGYTATVEGATTTTRMADLQLVAPTNQYLQQFPLDREFAVTPGNFLRVRVTFGTTVNALCYVIWQEG